MAIIYNPTSIPLRIPFSHYRSYNFIKPIRIIGVDTKLTDYQVKINLDSTNFPFEKCRADGYDVRLVDIDGQHLDFWVESWSKSNKIAILWTKISEISASTDKLIWLIYGNPSASSASSIANTFLFGDDFEEGTPIHNNYYDLSTKWTTISGDPTERHTFQPVHKTRIQEVNKTVDGSSRKYLAYDCEPYGDEIRLYYTDDLDGNWTAYSGNPILGPTSLRYRWPSVAYENGTFHMFLNDQVDTRIERWTSTDGITFIYQENYTPASAPENPFVWFNPNNDEWYLYYKRLSGVNSLLKAIHNSSIINLLSQSENAVGGPGWFAATSVMYKDDKYWFTSEGYPGSIWKVNARYATNPLGPITDCPDLWILENDEACPIQLISPNESKTYLFTTRRVNGTNWHQDTREILTPKYSYDVDENNWTQSDDSCFSILENRLKIVPDETYERIYRTQTINSNLMWESKLMVDIDTGLEGVFPQMYGNENNQRNGIYLDATAVKYLNSAGWQTSSETYSDDIYYKYKIMWDESSGKSSYYMNDTELASSQTPYSSTVNNRIEYLITMGETKIYYVDWTFVRKYNSPEPQVIVL